MADSVGWSILWLAVIAVLTLAVFSFHGSNLRSTVALAGVINAIFGFGVFIGSGQARATPLGLFNAACAMFVGAAGAYAAIIEDPRVEMFDLGLAILAGSVLQVLVTGMALGRSQEYDVICLSQRDSAWAIRWSSITLLFLLVISRVVPSGELSGWFEGAAVSATVVMTIGILWRPKACLVSVGSAVIIAVFVVYGTVFHSGGGRLRIVTLACSLVLLFTIRFANRAIKWFVVLATPLLLFWLAQQRLSLQESLEVGASAGRNGLESMTVPIVVFGRLIRAQIDGYPIAWGSSLLSFPASVVPASWFPDAPKAFGYELVSFYLPSRYGSGYSVAATVGAEAVFNFSVAGLVLFAVLISLLFRLMDSGTMRAVRGMASGRVPIVALAFWVIFVGGVADLAWNGQHVFILRTLTRLPFLAALLVLAVAGTMVLKNKEKPERPTGHPPPAPVATKPTATGRR